MKKLIFATALAIGSLTAVQAQDKMTAKKDSDKATMTQTAAQDFKEIKASELPKAVLMSVDKDFKGATVAKAYKNAKGEYKIVLNTADKNQQTLYANSKGEWMKKKKMK